MDGFSLKKLLVVASLFLIVQSAAECDKYQRAGETLSFVRCKSEWVGYNSSCLSLQVLKKCESFYDVCYSVEERNEIMKMWVRQYIRELVRYPPTYDDHGMDVKNGTCLENTVDTFMDEFEIDQIKSSILAENEDFYSNSLKVSNMTYKIYMITNEDGSTREIKKGYSSQDWSLPSFWSWCQWKLNGYKPGKLIEYMPNLFRCDGKCNNNTGDNQVWWPDSLTYTKWDPVNKEFIGEAQRSSLLEEEPIKNIWQTDFDVKYKILERADFTDFDEARITMCRGFKTLIDNLTEPVDRCIGQVQVKEVVWGGLLDRINNHVNYVIRVATKVTGNKKLLGDFTYRDCEMFGFGGTVGTVSGCPAKCVGNVFLMLALSISIMIFRMEV